MSRTPAAAAARLKVAYPGWTIERAGDQWRGLRIGRHGSGHSVGAPTVAGLEVAIYEIEDRTGPQIRPRARGAGARVP